MDHEAVQSADRQVVKSMDILAQSHVTVRESPATETYQMVSKRLRAALNSTLAEQNC